VGEGGQQWDVVIIGSPNGNPGYVLVGNKDYPEIAEDCVRCFAVLKKSPVDLFLGAHGDYFGLKEKAEKLKNGGPNPFVDPAGYKFFVATKEAAFGRSGSGRGRNRHRLREKNSSSQRKSWFVA